jgi:hypothetical protein
MKVRCYLRVGDDYTPCESIEKAKAEFCVAAVELYNYGQKLEGAIYRDKEDDYPDYLLSVGKFGGINLERA